MKRFMISFVASILAAVCVQALAPASFTVSTNSQKIVAERQRQFALFTNGQAVAQGALLRVGIRYYWALNSGIMGTNQPAHTYGDATDSSGIVWRVTTPNPRAGVVVINLATNPVYLSFGSAAELAKGIALTGYGSAFMSDYGLSQAAVYGISTVTNAAVSVEEW